MEKRSWLEVGGLDVSAVEFRVFEVLRKSLAGGFEADGCFERGSAGLGMFQKRQISMKNDPVGEVLRPGSKSLSIRSSRRK